MVTLLPMSVLFTDSKLYLWLSDCRF